MPKIGATDKNLLLIVRIFTVPMTALACMVAVLAYDPGYLLVVAFDVVLAGCFVPLMAAIYWPSMTPNAGEGPAEMRTQGTTASWKLSLTQPSV